MNKTIKLFLTLFYFTLASILVAENNLFISRDLYNIQFQLFAKFLNIFEFKKFLFPLIFILTFFMITLFKLFYNKYIQIIMTFSILVLISMKFSFGKISHNFHLWIISLLLFIFINFTKKLDEGINIFLIRTAQGLLLSTYFISGIWKIRGIVKDKFNTRIFDIGLNHIAASASEGNYVNSELYNFLIRQSYLISIGFILVILFQLSCIVPIVYRKFYKTYALFIFMFHFSTGISMKIFYSQQLIFAIFILYITEEIMHYQNSNKSILK